MKIKIILNGTLYVLVFDLQWINIKVYFNFKSYELSMNWNIFFEKYSRIHKLLNITRYLPSNI